MADETASVDGVSGGSDESRECMPCGGRGQLISNLGESPQNVTCPWCSGTGIRQANVDAQAAWRERQEAEAAAGGSPSGDSAPAESPEEAAAPEGEKPGAQAAGETPA